MSSLSPFHLWKDTVSSRTQSGVAYRGMHLDVLRWALRHKLELDLWYIHYGVGDFVLCELKGSPTELTHLELPVGDSRTLWLCLQFHGQLTLVSGSTVHPDTEHSLMDDGSSIGVTVPTDNVWTLFLGITGTSLQQLLTEYPRIRQEYDMQQERISSPIPISYLERQYLDMFAKASLGSFSTLHHIGVLLHKMYSSYVTRLDKYASYAP